MVVGSVAPHNKASVVSFPAINEWLAAFHRSPRFALKGPLAEENFGQAVRLR